MAITKVKSVCPYCGVGCGLVMDVEGNTVIKVTGDKDHPSNRGRLCTKGSTSAQVLADPGRMTHAYLRNDRHREPVQAPLDQAISATASRLRALLDEHGPQAIAFYVSGQMSLEAQYLANKLAKGFIGTHHIESNSRLCMASAGSGYKLSLGADGPPGAYDDIDHAELFFVIGANMADCHPILFLRLMDRVKAGARLIVVDPRRNTTADKADLFLQIRAGTDLALLNGLLHLLHLNGHTDPAFIAQFTEGWEVMPDFLATYTPEHVAELTGLSVESIRQTAQWIGEAQEWMSCWTMGLNQSTHGTWNTNALCNLHLATGKICRPGSGPFSLTGQPNAMGGREMGYMGPGLPGQRSMLVEEDRAFVEAIWAIAPDRLPTQASRGTVALFEEMQAGTVKACWIICTNPVASMANRASVIAGLQAAELVITQDAFLDTETNRFADILLPGALWAEADGVMINSERTLTLARQAVTPPGETLADWQIIARVACEMGYAEAFTYSNADQVFDEIKRFHNPATGYDLRGASYPRLRKGPLQWPCATETGEPRHPTRYLNDGVSQTLKTHDDGSRPRLVFATDSGKGRFFPRPHVGPAEMPDAEFPFVLNTGRLQHQWHTLTKTGKIPALNKLNPGPFVEIHPQDAQALGVSDKSRLEIRSRRGRAVLPVVVTDRVLPGHCFTPFHWNDVYGEHLAINAVTNDATDPISQQPEFKFCAVSLQPVALIEHEFLETPDATLRPACATTKERAMSRHEAFAHLVGIERVVAPTLNDGERTYLAGFLSGLNCTETLERDVPRLPSHAPFDPGTRLWLDGVLAGLFNTSRPTLATPSTAASQSASVTLLWASQTGNAERLSERLAERLRHAGMAVNLSVMADYSLPKLASTDTVLLLSSTFGDGDAPDNGEHFWRELQTCEHRLENLRYAVLALGDSNYDQFCQHGRNLDRRLSELGASRLQDCHACDGDPDEQVDAWFSALLPRLTGADPVPLEETPAPRMQPDQPSQPTASKEQPTPARLSVNLRLNSEGAHKDTRMLALQLEPQGLTYEAGDALGVWPRNCPELVQEVLERSHLRGEQIVDVGALGDMPLAEALAGHFEIARPSPEALALIAQATGNDELQRRLSHSREALKTWLWGRQLADVLRDFPVKLQAPQLLASLKRLQPRLYSIASSPSLYPNEVHLTVATVRYGSRKGVSSTFLADRAHGLDVPLFVQRNPNFRLPADGNTPIIMIGPGTGVAPFRGFLQERRARGDQGRNWLFFGEQHQASDFYYRDELLSLRDDGLLSRLSLAFSRDQPQKIYVQDRLREQGEDLWRWLEDGAYVYVCGDASHMARDVDQTLREIIARHGGLSEEQATHYLKQMSQHKRYVRDVY